MLALDNIRVLDLSTRAPGPFCTMTLSDLGADVLLVEAPAEADTGPRPQGDAAREAAFSPLRRNKRSIVLDLKQEEAQRIFFQLAKDADVVVEGFRPGVVNRLGIDYEVLKPSNPRLVYCSISGYGQDGPYRLLPGHDVNYIGFAGVLGLMGTRHGVPSIPYNLLGDYAAGGLLSAVAILSALWARQRTGEGQYIDMSMTDGSLYLIAPVMGAYFSDGHVPGPSKMRLNGGAPDYQAYRCADGKYLSVGCLEGKFWTNLCGALNRNDLLDTQHDPATHDAAIEQLSSVFASRPRDEWFRLLQHREVAVGKVYSADEIADDPQVEARGMLTRIDGPDGSSVPQVGVAPRLTGTPGRIRSAGLPAGASTDEVLGAIGYDKVTIGRLRSSGAVA